jgi:hypothetical protein
MQVEGATNLANIADAGQAFEFPSGSGAYREVGWAIWDLIDSNWL